MDSKLCQRISFDEDLCNICETKSNLLTCDKCGEGVCNNDGCSMLFPHYFNTLFVICNDCNVTISKKFKLVIDLSKIRLLKQKIENNQCRRHSKESFLRDENKKIANNPMSHV